MPKKIDIYKQRIDDCGIRLSNDDYAKIDDFCKDMPDGSYTITVHRSIKPKSTAQLGMIFGLMINETIAQCNDLGIDVSYFLQYLLADNIPKGQAVTKDLLHELMYIICPTTNEDGRRVTLSKMNTKQASDLFERFRTILSPMGVNVPDPDRYRKTKK